MGDAVTETAAFDPDSKEGRDLLYSLYDREPWEWPEEVILTMLRRSYSRPTIPPCRVCGGTLSVQAMGGGRPTEWACDGREDDPEHPGERRFKEGRRVADEHYSGSRFTDYRQGGDSLVIELIRRYLEGRRNQHVVRVVHEPGENGVVKVGAFGSPRRSHYLAGEARSSAVCIALEAAARSVARYEVPSGDGYTLRVEFVNEAGEPLAPRSPGSGVQALAETEAVAHAE